MQRRPNSRVRQARWPGLFGLALVLAGSWLSVPTPVHPGAAESKCRAEVRAPTSAPAQEPTFAVQRLEAPQPVVPAQRLRPVPLHWALVERHQARVDVVYRRLIGTGLPWVPGVLADRPLVVNAPSQGPPFASLQA